MKRYDQNFSLEINKTKIEVIRILEAKGGKMTAVGNIVINHNPPWYRVFAGRGIVTVKFTDTASSSGVVMQCILSPSLADARTILTFLLWNIPLWGALIYLFPWSILLAVVFFIEWLMMAFIAIPVLFLSVLLVSIFILSISLSGPTFFFIAVKWGFFVLLVNAALRYNRGELKRWIVKIFL